MAGTSKSNNKRSVRFAPEDDFAPLGEESEDEFTPNMRQSLCHIRIQQLTNKRKVTTVQGIPEEYDLKRIVRYLKKKNNCNGTVVTHREYGEVIQLTGDQRDAVRQFLSQVGIVRNEIIRVHGF